jgi:hypothetical protein
MAHPPPSLKAVFQLRGFHTLLYVLKLILMLVFYVRIRDFYGVIVDYGEARINLHLVGSSMIDISSLSELSGRLERFSFII